MVGVPSAVGRLVERDPDKAAVHHQSDEEHHVRVASEPAEASHLELIASKDEPWPGESLDAGGILRRLLNRSDKSKAGPRPELFGSSGPALIVHSAYHKAGTIWFTKIFDDLSAKYHLSFRLGKRGEPLPEDTDIAIYKHAWQFDRPDLNGRTFRGTHLVRDPRDLVISSYRYHLRTDETWAVTPKEKWGGISYQDYLKSLNQHDGLMTEIQRWSKEPHGPFVRMANWDYNQPEFLELRYEDLIADEERWFSKIFDQYGFNDDVKRVAMNIAESHSLRNIDKWKKGTEHVTSGASGQWQEFFEPDHVARLKETVGPLLIQLGYESDLDW